MREIQNPKSKIKEREVEDVPNARNIGEKQEQVESKKGEFKTQITFHMCVRGERPIYISVPDATHMQTRTHPCGIGGTYPARKASFSVCVVENKFTKKNRKPWAERRTGQGEGDENEIVLCSRSRPRKNSGTARRGILLLLKLKLKMVSVGWQIRSSALLSPCRVGDTELEKLVRVPGGSRVFVSTFVLHPFFYPSLFLSLFLLLLLLRSVRRVSRSE